MFQKSGMFMSWRQENNKLVKIFQFSNQEKLAHFFLSVAKISDELDHHADAKIFNCSKIEFTIFTHTSQTLTKKDFELVKLIDQCFINYK